MAGIVWGVSAGSTPALALERTLGWTGQDFQMTRRYESGVTERLLLQTRGGYRFLQFFALQAELETSLGQHWGPSLFGGELMAGFVNATSDLVLSYHQEWWSSWSVVEHRVGFYLLFEPRKTFQIIFGLGVRVPVFGARADSPELAVLFRVDGGLVRVWRLSLHGLLWNFDGLRMESGDNVHASLRLDWLMDDAEKWTSSLTATVGIKGISGGILSVDQNQIALGVRYVP